MPNRLKDSSDPASASALPASLITCLPLLWTRVLFPARLSELCVMRWRALLLLIVLPGALLYPCLSFPLFEPDEGRYAEIPREMLARGEWVVPCLHGEPYLDKPPLLYWLVMCSYRVLGVSEWAARLVPALALHGSVLAVYLLGSRSLGERAAFRGALVLSLAPGFMSMGRLLLLDGLLALWVTVSLLAAFEAVRTERLRWHWWLLAAVACGLGVLTKGPVAILLLVVPLWLHGRLACAGVRSSWLERLWFAVVVLAVALPWYVALWLRQPEFARYFLWEHNVIRFLAPFDHLRPIWFYGPVLLAGLLPATLLIPHFLRFLLSAEPAAVQRRSPELGFMLLAGGWCVLFFSLSGCKLPTYVLPAFPPLALALGYFLAGPRWLRSPWPTRWAGVGFVLLCGIHFVVLPWFAQYRSPLGRTPQLGRYFVDRDRPVLCYPRSCDTVAFYLQRDDIDNFRSKDIEELRAALRARPRTVVLFTHRHSLQGLRQALPPELCIVEVTHFGLEEVPGVPRWLAPKVAHLAGETALGLCDIAVVEHRTGMPHESDPVAAGNERLAQSPAPR